MSGWVSPWQSGAASSWLGSVIAVAKNLEASIDEAMAVDRSEETSVSSPPKDQTSDRQTAQAMTPKGARVQEGAEPAGQGEAARSTAPPPAIISVATPTATTTPAAPEVSDGWGADSEDAVTACQGKDVRPAASARSGVSTPSPTGSTADAGAVEQQAAHVQAAASSTSPDAQVAVLGPPLVESAVGSGWEDVDVDVDAWGSADGALSAPPATQQAVAATDSVEPIVTVTEAAAGDGWQVDDALPTPEQQLIASLAPSETAASPLDKDEVVPAPPSGWDDDTELGVSLLDASSAGVDVQPSMHEPVIAPPALSPTPSGVSNNMPTSQSSNGQTPDLQLLPSMSPTVVEHAEAVRDPASSPVANHVGTPTPTDAAVAALPGVSAPLPVLGAAPSPALPSSLDEAGGQSEHNKAARTHVDSSAEIVAHYEQRLQGLAAQLDAAAAKQEETDRLLHMRETKLQSMSEQLAGSLDEAASLRHSLQAAQSAIRTLEDASVTTSRRHASGDAARVAELEAELAEAHAKVNDILQEGSVLSKRVGTLEVAARQHRAALKAAEAERDAAKEEATSLSQRVASLSAELERVNSLASEAKAGASVAAESAASRHAALAELQEQEAKLQAEVRALRQSLAAAQKEVDDGKARIASALAEADAAESAAAQANALVASHQAAEAQATRVALAYEQQLRELRAQLGSVQALAGSQVDDLRAQVAEAEARAQRAESALEDSRFAAALPDHRAAGFAFFGDDDEAEVDDAASAFGSSRGVHGSATPTRPPAASPSVSHSAAHGNEVAMAVAAMQAEMQRKRDAWAASRAALQARLTAAETALADSEAEARRAEAAAVDANRVAAQLRAEVASARAARLEVSQEAAALTQRLQAAEAEVKALRLAVQRADARHAEVLVTLMDTRSKLEEVTASRAMAQLSVARLRDQLAAATTAAAGVAAAASASAATVSNETVAAGTDAQPAGNTHSSDAPLAHRSSRADLTASAALSRDESTRVAHAASANDLAQTLSSVLQGTPASAPRSALLAAVEAERDALAAQVVDLTLRLRDAEARAAVSDAARAELQELQAKYDVLLEMLGEREEEVDEARAELEEVRESFRAQLLTLMHSSPTSVAMAYPYHQPPTVVDGRAVFQQAMGVPVAAAPVAYPAAYPGYAPGYAPGMPPAAGYAPAMGAPVMVAPPPVYAAPAPMMVAPAPTMVVAPGYGYGHYHHHHHPGYYPGYAAGYPRVGMGVGTAMGLGLGAMMFGGKFKGPKFGFGKWK